MKIELHTHSSEISQCSGLPCRKLIELYKQAGYDAVVIANHFSSMTENYLAAQGCSEFHKTFHDHIAEAYEIGKEHGLLVLGAYELRFCENDNDYLVFGMTAEQCKNYQDIFAMGIEKFSMFARDNNILLYQAHPFRNQMTVVNPEYLFGIEIQNTHPRHDSRNEIAKSWAKYHGLHGIAGSDVHQPRDVGTSAIVTDYNVKNSADLVHILQNDLYHIE